jgi:hypothetical protein
MAELRQSGHTVEEVADFLLHYTKGQASSDPSSLPAGTADDDVFSAVFPTSVFDSPLPCLKETGS